MMATLEVLERAAEAGKNLVITHETPFYLHQDQTADLTDDATFQYKMNFIREHRMAVFIFMTTGTPAIQMESRQA